MAFKVPRNAPYVEIASAAYSEQVGTKRQAFGSIGESRALYPRNRLNKTELTTKDTKDPKGLKPQDAAFLSGPLRTNLCL